MISTGPNCYAYGLDAPAYPGTDLYDITPAGIPDTLRNLDSYTAAYLTDRHQKVLQLRKKRYGWRDIGKSIDVTPDRARGLYGEAQIAIRQAEKRRRYAAFICLATHYALTTSDSNRHNPCKRAL